MRVGQAKELFRSLTKEYFAEAQVVFANQSRTPMQAIPLVVITPGNVNRPTHPNYEVVDGVLVGNYLSRFSLTVDLFSNGTPVIDEETDETVAYEDNAEDDLLAFVDFLNSEYALAWSHRNDVSILVDGDVLSLTGVVNDTTYQYRARLTAQFYFTQRTVGHAAVLSEDSVKYPTGEKDPETGEPAYTSAAPEDTESRTGDWDRISGRKPEDNVIVKPEFTPTASGGGTEELASLETGYFTEAEIKEEKADG